MEVWTFIHKNTNELIRCDILSNDVEFGNMYYFLDNKDGKYSPFWFIESEEKAKLAYYKGHVHEQYSNNFERPNTDKININDYKIIKFIFHD